MSIKILVMGLSGSGKTFLSRSLKNYLEQSNHTVIWLNNDELRKTSNDWDFSYEGRIRQSIRMTELADKSSSYYVICDFIAPLTAMRDNLKADWTIWMDTIDNSKYTDTNKIFTPPEQYDFRITEQNCEKWATFVGGHIMRSQC